MSNARQLAANLPREGGLSNRNLIINGAMQVAQRGTSFTGITTTAYHTVDRFKTAINLAGTWTATQEPNGPDGFTKSLKYECTTANTSLNANAYAIITHDIEAQNLQHLQYGSSGAKTLTLSFYVKSNKTGTYSHEISHSDVSSPSTSYYNASQFTINAADTWEYKTIQIAGQTVDQIDNDNGRGLSLNFWFVAGSAFTTGTYNANTWHGTAADRAVGVVNLADTVGNYIQLAGVQLEVGDTATPFEHRSYGDELKRCERFLQVWTSAGTYPYFMTGRNHNSTTSIFTLHYRTEMRARPTLSWGGQIQVYDGADRTANSVGFNGNAYHTCGINIGLPSGGVGTNYAAQAYFYPNAYVRLDAEL